MRQVTYDVVLLEEDGTILDDQLGGEFSSIMSAKRRIEIYRLENPEFWKDGAYMGIREIKREIVSKTY